MAQGKNIIFANNHLDVRRRNGDEWLALCPYHDDSNPSFSYNIAKGVFICYSCGAKGNTETLAEHLGASFKKPLGSEDIPIEKVKQNIAKFYEEESRKLLGSVKEHPAHKVIRVAPQYQEMWATRGITNQEVLDMFSLGYDPLAHALLIPIHSKGGNITGIIKRNMVSTPESPKYVYPAGLRISHHLFGEWQVRCWAMNHRIKSLVIVEGSIDALSMWQVGIPAVALLGAQMSYSQSQILKALDPYSVVIMTDMDSAGSRAALTVSNAISHGKMGIINVRAKWDREEAKDPAELSPERRVEIFKEIFNS